MHSICLKSVIKFRKHYEILINHLYGRDKLIYLLLFITTMNLCLYFDIPLRTQLWVFKKTPTVINFRPVYTQVILFKNTFCTFILVA